MVLIATSLLYSQNPNHSKASTELSGIGLTWHVVGGWGKFFHHPNKMITTNILRQHLAYISAVESLTQCYWKCHHDVIIKFIQ